MLRDAIEDMQFRQYRRGDLDALYALDTVCFAEPFRFTRSMVRHSAEAEDAITLVAEREQQPISFGIVHLQTAENQPVGYLVTLDVAPGERRRGLAREMLLRLEATAASRGCRAMLLHVFTGNAGAIRLYEELGYERAGMADGFYAPGLDAWMYRKALPDAAA